MQSQPGKGLGQSEAVNENYALFFAFFLALFPLAISNKFISSACVCVKCLIN